MAETSQKGIPSKFTPNKVNPEQKDFILQQFAEGYRAEEVRQKLSERFGLDVHIETVKRYSWKEQDRIVEKRRALANQLDRLRASSKFNRVRRLEQREDRLEENKEMEDKFKERLLLDNSEQQRKEMEGFKGILSFDPDNPFSKVNASLGDVTKALEALKQGEETKFGKEATEKAVEEALKEKAKREQE